MIAVLVVLCALLAATPLERSALHALYAATDGEGWANQSGWLGAGDPCDWFGVGCDGGAVVALDMRTGTDEYGHHFGNSMAGTLPTQLSGAAGLARLFFYDSRISGTMPTELMELTRLEELALANSPHVEGLPGHFSAAPLPMSGTVPTQIAALEGLGVLVLQYSSLSGTLPLELRNLTSLSVVSCTHNCLSGTVPPQLAALGKLSTLSLGNTSLSGTIVTQLSELKTLTDLYLANTSLSGTVPTQLSELKTLRRLVLTSTSLSGTVPPRLTNLNWLTELFLDATPLSGTMPPHLTKLTELTNLDLGHTSLSGTLPSSVGALPALTNLDLYDMRLSGTVPASVLRHCTPFGPVQCDGLPPFSCSAFGLDRSRLSLTSFGACVHCPPHEETVARASLFLVLLPVAVVLYIRAVDRFPHFKTWIASASLIVSHLQIVGLLSSLTSVESVSPGGALATLRAALLVCIDLGTVEPQCLLEPEPKPQYRFNNVFAKDGSSGYESYAAFDLHAFLTSPAVFGTATAFVLPFAAIVAIHLAQLIVEKRGRGGVRPSNRPALSVQEGSPQVTLLLQQEASSSTAPAPSLHAAAANKQDLELVDKHENWAVIVFTLQLPTVCRVGLRTTVLGAYGDSHYSLCVGVPILAIELAYALNMLCQIRAMQGLRSWRRIEVTLPISRLDDRLQYLTGRYKNTAPYWQFVLSARQLAIIGIVAGFEAYDDTTMVLAEAGAAFAVLAAALVLHCRVQPYFHRYQNIAEVVLSLFSMLAIIAACTVYWHRTHLTQVSIGVFGIALVGMLLGPAIVFAIYVGVQASRIKPKPLLIFHCSPSSAPLLNVRPEAEDVKRAYGDDAEACSGTSELLRVKLLELRPARFLFAGHANHQLDADKRTLAFVDDTGRLDVVRPETLVDVFRSLRERRGDVLELVFLNGCESEALGRALCQQANVPWVVCWRTKCNDETARLFSVYFFEALGRVGALEEEPYRSAFHEAKGALMTCHMRAGILADCSTAAQVPKFQFSDPRRHAPSATRGDLATLTDDDGDDGESGEPAPGPGSPTPPASSAIPAGVPVLLCTNGDDAECSVIS